MQAGGNIGMHDVQIPVVNHVHQNIIVRKHSIFAFIQIMLCLTNILNDSGQVQFEHFDQFQILRGKILRLL